jgi:hypothetical protein
MWRTHTTRRMNMVVGSSEQEAFLEVKEDELSLRRTSINTVGNPGLPSFQTLLTATHPSALCMATYKRAKPSLYLSNLPLCHSMNHHLKSHSWPVCYPVVSCKIHGSVIFCLPCLLLNAWCLALILAHGRCWMNESTNGWWGLGVRADTHAGDKSHSQWQHCVEKKQSVKTQLRENSGTESDMKEGVSDLPHKAANYTGQLPIGNDWRF